MGRHRQKLSKFLKMYYENIQSTDEIEIWKDIELGDYPIYEVSNHGLVRRKDNKNVINPFHSYRKDHDGNFRFDHPTYLRVQLYYYENGVRKKKHFEISRLVALNFIPIPKKYLRKGLTAKDLEVNHIRGGYEIYNNFTSNLEWCTTQENIGKAIETNLIHPRKGEQHHATFFDEADVIKICKCLEKGMNARDTYALMDIDDRVNFDKFKGTFYNIKYKNSWKFVSQYFNF